MKIARGFSLVELMIALALGAIVITGAFQINQVFNRQSVRQQKIADMQQSLRVSRQVMERIIRGAGSGLQGGSLSLTNCAGTPVTYYGVQWSDSNAATFPKTTFNGNPALVDTDPDWIQIVAADPNYAVGGTQNNGANMVVNDTSQFNIGDLFVVVNTNVDPSKRKSCVYEVTHLDNSGGNRCATCGALQHNSGGSCYNPPPGRDTCINSPDFPFPAPIRKISANSAIFRIDNTDPNSPRLTASFARIGSPPAFQLVAENIEDLQIAFVMADGRVCNSVDDPAICDPRQAHAVRFTLTARSSSPVGGFQLGQTGGFEDEPVTQTNDGYLRRSVTTEVQIRNNP